jgi:outer membrane protein assembly factor BamB
MNLPFSKFSFLSKSMLVALSASLSVGVATDAIADNWPSFRGPDRSSVVNDSTLLKSWPEGGPKLLWEGKGAGRGYASLAIVDDRMYTLGDGISTKGGDSDEYLTCFERATGKQLWATKTGKPWTQGKTDWQNSRGTPTVDSGKVYVITPDGVLFCCQSSDGKTLWQKNLKEEFGGSKADQWGYSESPLVDGDFLLCTPGGQSNTVVALKKSTGEKVWSCASPEDRGAGHSSIVITNVQGKKVYVQSTGSGLIGFNEVGKLLWSYPIEKTTAVIPTPVVRKDLIFYPVGYKKGGALVQQVVSKGQVTVKEIYGLNPKLANKHGGVVLVGDYVYGDSDDAGIPYCANLMTGELKWSSRGAGKGSAVVVAAYDRLYIRFQNGVMALAEASPDGYKEVGMFKIPGSDERPSWSHPVILDGKLYLREQDKILCYDIRG